MLLVKLPMCEASCAATCSSAQLNAASLSFILTRIVPPVSWCSVRVAPCTAKCTPASERCQPGLNTSAGIHKVPLCARSFLRGRKLPGTVRLTRTGAERAPSGLPGMGAGLVPGSAAAQPERSAGGTGPPDPSSSAETWSEGMASSGGTIAPRGSGSGGVSIAANGGACSSERVI